MRPTNRLFVNIHIDDLPDGQIGFGVTGGGGAMPSEHALELLTALQMTLNEFARVNDIPHFDCTREKGAADA